MKPDSVKREQFQKLQAEARAAGINGAESLTSKAIDQRRIQLWGMTLVLLLTAMVSLVFGTNDMGVATAAPLSLYHLKLVLIVLVVIYGIHVVRMEKRFQSISRQLETQRIQEASSLTAQKVAEQSSRANSEFLARMNHEIRTPMNAIFGMTKLTLATSLTDKQRSNLARVDRASHSLLRILDDVLDFSRIEAGQLELEYAPFNLELVIRHVIDVVGANTPHGGPELIVNIDPDLPVNLVGDSLRLSQVLVNLTGNAIKFTDQGEVELNLSEAHRDRERVAIKFSVMDTGIGIAEDQLDRVFSAFSQTEPSITRKYGGNGLGLTIARELVQQMGGTIEVESTPGKGSCFRFTAWINFQQPEAARNTEPGWMHNRPDVLLIDDNQFSAASIASLLTQIHCHCVVADGPETAIPLVSSTQHQFALVMMNHMAESWDSVDLATQIRDHSPTGQIPILFMVTVSDQKLLGDTVERVCGSSQIEKPLTRGELINAITDLLDHNHSKRQAVRQSGPPLQSLARARVLVVDDDDISQMLLSELLNNNGCEVVVAGHGAKALELLSNPGNFDAVLMDIHMPVMDGFETSRRIRKRHDLENLPIIAMTGDRVEDISEAYRNAGINAYLTKPVDPAPLLETLSTWVHRIPASATDWNNVTEAAASDPQLTALDTGAGLKVVQGNHDIYQKVLRKFRAGQNDVIRRIRESLAADDKEGAIRLTHNLKGLAANIGAHQLRDIAENLQQVLNDYPRTTPSFNILAAQLDKVMRSVTLWLDSRQNATNEATGTPMDVANQELVNELASLAREISSSNTQAMDRLQSIRERFDLTRFDADFRALDESVSYYDFDRASGQLEHLSQKIITNTGVRP